MSIKLDKYTPLMMYLSPASIPQIVAHIQDYLVKHPILSVETIAEIIVQSLQEHPELINGEAIPISADSAQSIKAYIDALPALDTYTKAEINALLLGKQDTLTFDQAPTPGSSNPVTSSGIIAAMSALQSALETQIGLKADSASTYTKSQVDTLLEDKADADDVYSKNTMDAKLLEINTDIDNLEDDLSHQSQQIDNVKAAAAYVEDGDTASRTYTTGQFILWKGLLYTVKTGGMPQGATINTAYLNPVTGGGFNALNSQLILKCPIFTWSDTETPRTSNDAIIAACRAFYNTNVEIAMIKFTYNSSDLGYSLVYAGIFANYSGTVRFLIFEPSKSFFGRVRMSDDNIVINQIQTVQ